MHTQRERQVSQSVSVILRSHVNCSSSADERDVLEILFSIRVSSANNLKVECAIRVNIS